jgi:MoaA/NifB/PqqE/SkfB family radical SAM enzyme
VDGEKALDAIDRLADLGVSHITLTGGEPLLHPMITDFVRKASSRGMHNAVLDAAPGLLLRNDIISRLDDAGADIISVSFDSGDPAVMEKSRKIKNIYEDIKKAVSEIKKTRMKSMASMLIWNENHDKLEEVCEKAADIGFDLISLNYPTFSESDVYELGGEGVNLSRERLIQSLENAIKLKKSRKYNIINSSISMRNIINYLKNPASARYHCFGGKRVMFVDWFLDTHPCMQLKTSLGSVLTIDKSALGLPACNKCNMSWYRDFSMFFQGARTIPTILESLASVGYVVR